MVLIRSKARLHPELVLTLFRDEVRMMGGIGGEGREWASVEEVLGNL